MIDSRAADKTKDFEITVNCYKRQQSKHDTNPEHDEYAYMSESMIYQKMTRANAEYRTKHDEYAYMSEAMIYQKMTRANDVYYS